MGENIINNFSVHENGVLYQSTCSVVGFPVFNYDSGFDLLVFLLPIMSDEWVDTDSKVVSDTDSKVVSDTDSIHKDLTNKLFFTPCHSVPTGAPSCQRMCRQRLFLSTGG